MEYIKTGEKYFKLILSIILVFILIGVFYTIAMSNVVKDSIINSTTSSVVSDNTENKKYALANGKKIYIEVADNDETRKQGLSDRDGLCTGCGMLFVFPQNGYYGFWMKDMNFNIDIVFLDENKQIVDIYKNADKNSYHQLLTRNNATGRMENTSTIFRNTSPAKYVLELPAYASDIYRLVKGNTIDITDR